MIVLAGLGRMGGALAGRLQFAGLEPRLYDVATEPRARFNVEHASLTEAVSGCESVLLCLPDARAVEGAVADILDASPLPELVIDLTSSEPAVTRRLGRRLSAADVDFIDAPLSGGVAGAKEGRLTAMVGGPVDLLERARPLLETFCSSIEHAGDLGAGHATKAINNTLSAVSLLVTSRACKAAPVSEAEAVAYFNAHRGSSQNSEVKFPRDILPRTFAAGFTIELMHKDVGIAVRMATDAGVPVPITREIHELLDAAGRSLGGGTDFTRVFEFVDPLPAATLEALDGQIYDACAAAARELLALAAALGLDPGRVLAIVNVSTGRSIATIDLAKVDAWH